jgi:menaquinone-9 beta-reductase
MTDSMRSYDLIIVGGGVAGSALATLMSRAGARVAVLERDREFRDRIRGEWLAPWGVAEMRRLGLMDTLAAAGAQPLPALAGRTGKPRVLSTPEGDMPITFYHPALQQSLADAAWSAGAEVIRGARVTSVAGGSSATVTYTLDGEAHELRGRVAVGADGRSSLVRAALGKEQQTHRHPRMLAGVRLRNVRGNPTYGHFIINEEAGGHASVFPQPGGFARAYVFTEGMTTATFAGPDGYARFIEAAISLGVPAETLSLAEQAGPLAAFAAEDSWVPRPAANSLILIGDAAGISDPTWGMGLALAFRDVGALSEALLATSDWDAAAQAYATAHDRHFGAIITAENWQSELQLSHGPDALRRRRHAMALWSKEPDRALDLPGLGPDVDVSEAARIRFFGEDVPMSGSEDQAPSPVPLGTEQVPQPTAA